ncbi:unnamed protein product [Mytilus coruscus]|uniref:Integrase zinc-binding domain-containing protein n=1 Tax=Mytilus coruscus TaxID=42192 RepID=A0A6J8DHX7_MYTCO|nr:unnamed protein product [Mytilus coruscus]
MSRLVTDNGEFCKQCEMPWGYGYEGPIETEIKYMKEGDKKSIDVVSENSDSHDDHTRPSFDCVGNNNTNVVVDPDSGESPLVRRGRKSNRPKIAEQKPMPNIDLRLETVRARQEADIILGKILNFKLDKIEKPAWEEICGYGLNLKFWLAKWELLEIRNNVLCLKWVERAQQARWKICVPESLVDPILWYLHDARTGAHLGIKKTYEKAKLSPFYWRDMQGSIKLYIQQCEICGERKSPMAKKRHQMKSYVVGAPFERIAKTPKDWDEHLDYIVMAYNATPHESTGITPHRMIYGREMSFPLNLMTETVSDDNEEENFISEYVNKLEHKLREAHELARNNLKSAAERQKNIFDAKVRPVVYNVGDYVWRNQKKNVPGIKLKIARHWTGPWVITEKLSDITFKVKCAKNSPEVTVHGDILKPYLGSKKMVWFNQQNARPDMPDVPEQHPVEFPDLAKFTADVDDESSSVSENLPGILGEKKYVRLK